MSESFNACRYLLDRHVEEGRGDRVALTGADGELSYGQLHDRVRRTAAGLRAIGLRPEQRVLMFMADSPDFVTLFLALLRMGAVAVPVSTMLHADGLAELLRDSRATLLAVSSDYAATGEKASAQAPELAGVLVGEGASVTATATVPVHELAELANTDPDGGGSRIGGGSDGGSGIGNGSRGGGGLDNTVADSPAFWLYTSGTTGTPKAAMHRHEAIRVVYETYAAQVLGITADDRCLSAAKAFFAYGLGNSVLFPLAAGATAILEAAPARPQLLADRAREYGATLFFAGPSFFAAMLHTGLPGDALAGVRLSTSAGETLPAALYERWTRHFGIDILDGIGMTEMLHIFLSNRPGSVRPGTTGLPVPGYHLRILDEAGHPVVPGTPGTLYVRGESTATGYWARFAASRQVFQGEWLRTGDTYVEDPDGYYTCLGRTGDMIKASGVWVAPAEVEARLLEHPAVGQTAVVAALDGDGLEKPVAYVVRVPGAEVTEPELIEFCRAGLPSVKRPRRVVFIEALPTTATGKVRRVELRALAVGLLREPEEAAG